MSRNSSRETHLREKFVDLVDGRLSVSDAADLEREIQSIPSLAEEFRQYRELVGAMATLPAPSIPSDLSQRLRAGFRSRDDESQDDEASDTEDESASPSLWARLGGVRIAAAFFALTFAGWALIYDGPVFETLSAPNSAPTSMQDGARESRPTMSAGRGRMEAKADPEKEDQESKAKKGSPRRHVSESVDVLELGVSKDRAGRELLAALGALQFSVTKEASAPSTVFEFDKGFLDDQGLSDASAGVFVDFARRRSSEDVWTAPGVDGDAAVIRHLLVERAALKTPRVRKGPPTVTAPTAKPKKSKSELRNREKGVPMADVATSKAPKTREVARTYVLRGSGSARLFETALAAEGLVVSESTIPVLGEPSQRAGSLVVLTLAADRVEALLVRLRSQHDLNLQLMATEKVPVGADSTMKDGAKRPSSAMIKLRFVLPEPAPRQ